MSILVWAVTLLLFARASATVSTFQTANGSFAAAGNWSDGSFPVSATVTGCVPVNAYLAVPALSSQSFFYIGKGGTGSIVTFKSGSQFVSTKDLCIGDTTNGTLVVEGGSHSIRNLKVASTAGTTGSGTLRFVTNGTLTVTGNAVVGSSGVGTIVFDGAGRLVVSNGVGLYPTTGGDETVFKFNGTTNSGLLEIYKGNGGTNWNGHTIVLDIGYTPAAFTNTFLKIVGSTFPLNQFLIVNEGRYFSATVTKVTTGSTNSYVLTQQKITEFRSTAELTTLLDVFPVSPCPLTGGNQTFTATETYTNSGSSWWVPFSEEHVFQARLVNIQSNNAVPPVYDSMRSWDLRIGKGGQIYSLKGSFGEAIPPQYRGLDIPTAYDRVVAYGPYFAPWVDEVFQTVFVDSTQNVTTDPYFHHQAGVYLVDTNADANGGGVVPFYSPYLGGLADISKRNYRIVSWPQQAHIPTTFASDLICYTEYRDVGQGILEVNHLVYNFGCYTQSYINLPWGGVRHTSFGNYFISNPDGTMRPADSTETNFNDTAGWALLCHGTGPSSDTIGIVFGKDADPLKSGQTAKSRWGNGSPDIVTPSGTPEDEWRNYFRIMTVRKMRIKPGETFFGRYYLVFGRQDTVTNNLIGPYGLVANCDYSVSSITIGEAQTMNWYQAASGLPTTAVNGSIIATTYNKPVAGKKPLFVIENTLTGAISLTNNPYALSDKPYDGTTKILGFLGYN
ncbi:MAG: hypothetical protein HOO88_08535 [Kiritimatiellaceae bacterium]|nr:hypothetical protein [Kiritimatiellaceae bacterium]